MRRTRRHQGCAAGERQPATCDCRAVYGPQIVGASGGEPRLAPVGGDSDIGRSSWEQGHWAPPFGTSLQAMRPRWRRLFRCDKEQSGEWVPVAGTGFSGALTAALHPWQQDGGRHALLCRTCCYNAQVESKNSDSSALQESSSHANGTTRLACWGQGQPCVELASYSWLMRRWATSLSRVFASSRGPRVGVMSSGIDSICGEIGGHGVHCFHGQARISDGVVSVGHRPSARVTEHKSVAGCAGDV